MDFLSLFTILLLLPLEPTYQYETGALCLQRWQKSWAPGLTWQAAVDLLGEVFNVDAVLQQDAFRPDIDVTVLAQLLDQTA